MFFISAASLQAYILNDFQARIKELGESELDLYRQIPSFMKFIEANKSKVSLLTDDKEFRKFLLKSLQVSDSSFF